MAAEIILEKNPNKQKTQHISEWFLNHFDLLSISGAREIVNTSDLIVGEEEGCSFPL